MGRCMSFSCEASDIHLPMYQVQAHGMRSYQMRVRPLNHTDGMLRPFGTPTKHENSVGQRVRNNDLVMNGVIHETMDGTSQHRPLSGNHSFRGHFSICQPGKCRHTRL